MSVATVTITFLDQPLPGDVIAYSISSMGVPLIYDQGVSSVYKEFKNNYTSSTKYITAVTDFMGTFQAVDYGAGFNGNTFDSEFQGSTGKYIVCGNFTTYNGDAASRIVRLNADGSIDTTFTPPAFNNLVRKVIFDSVNDKLYVIGSFTGVSGYSRIMKLNQNGTIDTSFAPVNITNAPITNPVVVYDAHLHANGNLFIVGDFKSVAGSTRNNIACLTPAGINAPGITFGGGLNGIGFTIDSFIGGASIGRLVIGGTFTTYNSFTANSIVEITAIGSYYSPFNSSVGTGFTGAVTSGVARVRTVFIDQSTNKIYCGGTFTGFKGNVRNRIIRLNEDGSDDTAVFAIGNGLSGLPHTITKSFMGNILVGGEFATYNGTPCDGLVALNVANAAIAHTPSYTFDNGASPSIIRNILAVNGRNVLTGDFTSSANTNAIQSQLTVPIAPTTSQATADNTEINLITFNSAPEVVYSTAPQQVIATITYGGIDDILVYDIIDAPGRVVITVTGENTESAAELILARSPHFVVNTFTAGTVDTAKIKLFIYKGDFIFDLPATPTREFTKTIVMDAQASIYFNVSNYLREFCNTNIDAYMAFPTFNPEGIAHEEATWVRMEMETYLNNVLVEELEAKMLGVDGFGWVEEGSNPVPSPVFLTADEHDVLRKGTSRVYFIAQDNEAVEVRTNLNPTFSTILYNANTQLSYQYIQSIWLETSLYDWIEYRFTYPGLVITKRFNFVSDCMYDRVELIFKNKFGVLQSLPFVKKLSNSYNIENKNYNSSILQQDATYDPRQHSIKTYLSNGQREIIINTGYVEEYFNVSLNELFHSEEIYLNEDGFVVPVILVDKTFNVKTVRNNKLIQYTLKLKQAQASINKIT